MKKQVFTFITIFISISCLAQQEVVVKGTILNNKFSQAQLMQVSTQNVLAQDNQLTDGKFTIRTNVPYADIYKLAFDNSQFIMLILSPKDSVFIEIDPSNFSYPKITGTGDSKKLYSVINELGEYDAELLKMQQQTELKKQELMQSFIANNKTSLATLFFADKIDASSNSAMFQELITSLESTYPNNVFVIDFKRKLNEQLYLGTGQLAPEISLPDTSGKIINLSSLRGKVVLIDFWAGWCGPCRKENPNVVRLYNEYKDKGFEIYGVSLDRNKPSWQAAIKQDNITWVQVSDLSSWGSSVIKQYNITGIPFTVLIDKDGKILAKGLRGEALEERLKEIFNSN